MSSQLPLWFETFFQGVANEFWTRAMPPEITEAEATFLEEALQAPPGAQILDFPCGNGRHAMALARRGYQMTGMDLSGEFLEAARAASSAEGLEIEYHARDMRRPELAPESFNGAYCFGNSFPYLDHPNAAAFLSGIARSLSPGARFVLDTGCAAESILPALPPRRWHRFGDIIVLSEARYQAMESRIDIDYTFIRDGQIETRPAISYVFTLAEIRRMFESAGLEVLTCRGGLHGEAYAPAAQRLLLIARRP